MLSPVLEQRFPMFHFEGEVSCLERQKQGIRIKSSVSHPYPDRFRQGSPGLYKKLCTLSTGFSTGHGVVNRPVTSAPTLTSRDFPTFQRYDTKYAVYSCRLFHSSETRCEKCRSTYMLLHFVFYSASPRMDLVA